MVVIATITQSINLEVARPNIFQALVAKQYDSNSRFLKVTFVNNGKVIEVSPTATITINANRNDGQSKSFAGLVNSDGTVTVPLTAWMLGISGTLYCDVSIIDEESSKLTSTKFTVMVEQASCSDEDISQDEDYDILTQLIQEVSELKKDLPEDGVSPTVDITPITGGNRMVITDASGSKTVDIMDGKDGKDGKDGTEVETSEFVPLMDVAYGDKTDFLSKNLVAIMPTEYEVGSYSSITVAVGGYDSDNRWTITFTFDGLSFVNEMQYYPHFNVVCKPGDAIVLNKYIGISETDTFYLTYADLGISALGLFDGILSASVIAKMVCGGVDGTNGVDGESAYQYARDGGYTGTEESFAIKLAQEIPTVTQEAGQSESLVMSQKAVTDLVNTALDEIKSDEYETVDSVDKMTDKTKQYVLSTDGFVYAYTEKFETVEHKATNKFIASECTINKRMGSSSMSDANGFVWTGAIPIDLTKESPFRIKVEGTMLTTIKMGDADEAYQKIWLCADNTGTTKLSAGLLNVGNTTSNYATTLEDGTFYADYKGGAKLSNDIITGTKYIRIGFKYSTSAIASTSAVTGVSITFPSDEYTEQVKVSGWQSTGMTPSQYSDGSYVDLLVKINDNTTDISEMNSRVIALESGSNSVTIPSYWKNAVDVCVAKIKSLQVGRHCVTFPFFSDNHNNNRCAGALIAHVMKECHIPYCFFGGDVISNGDDVTSESVMLTQDRLFDEMMSVIPIEKMCRTLGNHDAYWNPTPSNSSTRVYYTRAQIYDLFLRQEAISQNKHCGGDGTYYYVDDLASRTRFVICNTNFNANTSTETLDSEQIDWLENEVLVFNQGGWSLVFISHQPITNHYHSNIHAETATAIQELLTNYANGNSAHKAEIVGWFSGHIHADRIYTGAAANTTDDSVKNTLPWKTVTIRADNTILCRDESLKHTPTNDDKSHAIDFVTINRKTRTVNLTRLGIGEDRSYTY